MQHLLIAYFLSNLSAKYYENPAMLSRVIAKNIADVFLRHSVCRPGCAVSRASCIDQIGCLF